MTTVRDATFDFLRRRELTDIFSNPGSTEIPFLTGLPDDLNFVLGLHEGTVVSMASGYALARRRPSATPRRSRRGAHRGTLVTPRITLARSPRRRRAQDRARALSARTLRSRDA